MNKREKDKKKQEEELVEAVPQFVNVGAPQWTGQGAPQGTAGDNATVTPTTPVTQPEQPQGTIKETKPAAIIHDDKTAAGAGTEVPGAVASTPMTWLDQTHVEVDRQMQEVINNILKLGSQRFSFTPTDSPLYTVMREEHEREAARAAGEAYARIAQNTGGFGSSYAGLAAEEARRGVMEGFHEQQDELYAAALAEHEGQMSSLTDRYNTLLALKGQLGTQTGAQTVTTADGQTMAVSDTARAAYEAYAGSYTGTNRETIKAAMMAGGVSAEDAEAAIGLMDSVVNAGYGDMAGQLARDPTLSGAVSLWQQVKSTEQEGAYAEQISGAATASITAAMDNMDTAYEALGVTPESWDEMFAGYDDPDERATAEKAYILDMAGEYRRQGILTADDYTALYQRELDETMQAMRDGDGTAVLASQMAIALQNDLDKGNLTQNEYLRLMDHVAANIDLDAAWDELGESLVDKAVGKGTDLISKLTRGHVQVPEWMQKTIGVLGELNLSVLMTAFGGGFSAGLSGGLSKILGDVTVKQQIMKRMSMDADEYAAFKALLERKAALEEKTA